jgi:hypothetical protein
MCRPKNREWILKPLKNVDLDLLKELENTEDSYFVYEGKNGNIKKTWRKPHTQKEKSC